MTDFVKSLLGFSFKNLANLLLIFVVTKVLGDKAVGEFLYAMTFSLTLSIICEYGFNLSHPVAIAKEKVNHGSTLALKLWLTIVCFLVFLIIIFCDIYPYDSMTFLFVFSSIIMNSFTNFHLMELRGKGEFFGESKFIIKNNLTLLVLSCISLFIFEDLLIFSISLLFSRVLFYIYLINRIDLEAFNLPIFMNLKQVLLQFNYGFTYFLIVALGVIYVSIDILYLGYFLDSSEITFYQLASQIMLAICITSNTLSQVFVVKFSQKQNSFNDVRKRTFEGFSIAVILSIAVGILYYFAFPIISGFILNENYKNANELTFIFTIIVCLRHVIGISSAYLTSYMSNVYRIICTVSGLFYMLINLYFVEATNMVLYVANVVVEVHIVIAITMLSVITYDLVRRYYENNN
ncbi:oligosaccharide flippase family protein [Shewanella sp. SG44-2]|uniref:oligosaccharide flippase family protein n=1 Tax=Shewanella sp. SG44-2 TaxID=2760962 RepID=UPI0016044B25|nr:oligosaccharide flippase family protein [Shewanella sp. SG44-2]MBB1428474.1 oligosaccharide flippase family protein [Shewanella sp. SG44-2]